MTQAELLAQLKDIRPPVEPAWWLPAPGHLLSGLVLLLLLAITAIWLLRRHADRRLIQARRELQRIATEHPDDSSGLARALAPWLKRVALQAFPEQRLERVTGEAWLEFLDRGVVGEGFSRGAGNVFGADIYRPLPVSRVGREELLALCDSWLAGIAPRLRGRGS